MRYVFSAISLRRDIEYTKADAARHTIWLWMSKQRPVGNVQNHLESSLVYRGIWLAENGSA